MKAGLNRISVSAIVACIALISATEVADAQTRERLAGSRVEGAVVFGAAIAGKEIGRGINATGGREQRVRRIATVGLQVRDALGAVEGDAPHRGRTALGDGRQFVERCQEDAA